MKSKPTHSEPMKLNKALRPELKTKKSAQRVTAERLKKNAYRLAYSVQRVHQASSQVDFRHFLWTNIIDNELTFL